MKINFIHLWNCNFVGFVNMFQIVLDFKKYKEKKKKNVLRKIIFFLKNFRKKKLYEKDGEHINFIFLLKKKSTFFSTFLNKTKWDKVYKSNIPQEFIYFPSTSFINNLLGS